MSLSDPTFSVNIDQDSIDLWAEIELKDKDGTLFQKMRFKLSAFHWQIDPHTGKFTFELSGGYPIEQPKSEINIA